MTTRLRAWVCRQPVIAFYVLAFVITWLGWVPQALYSRELFPFDSPLFYVFGGVGPLVAVAIVRWALHPEDVAGQVFRRLVQWRVGLGWYLVAFLGYPAIWLTAVALRGEPGDELDDGVVSWGIPAAFVVSFVAAIPEEVGWRGFALPRLQARSSALISSLIVGVLWWAWHLPLLLNEDNVMSSYPMIPYFVSTVALSVVYAWLFNSTAGSVLIVALFHASSNAAAGNFVGIEQAVVIVLVAVAIVVLYGPRHLSRRGERVIPGPEPRPGVSPART